MFCLFDKVVFGLSQCERSRRFPLLQDHHQCVCVFLMGSLEEDPLSNEGVSHSWLSGWGGAREISLLPLSDRGSTAFSLFSFHRLQREPFHNDLPTVISLLKAVALGSGQEAGCVLSSLRLLVLCDLLGFACTGVSLPRESLCWSDAQALGIY